VHLVASRRNVVAPLSWVLSLCLSRACLGTMMHFIGYINSLTWWRREATGRVSRMREGVQVVCTDDVHCVHQGLCCVERKRPPL
jgi:hypothetical protein